MFGFGSRTPAARRDYSDCCGCSLCLLVCPVWRLRRDPRLTPKGCARALQHGAGAADLIEAVDACWLCGACDAVCPENLELLEIVLDFRRQLPHAPVAAGVPASRPAVMAKTMLLPGSALRQRPAALAQVCSLLAAVVDVDDGAAIVAALESGAAISESQRQSFLEPLRRQRRIIVADGLLLRQLRQWLPQADVVGLGQALSAQAALRRALRPDDLYVIEPLAYHADYERLVGHYDRLRSETGVMMNLDLQRIAIPAAARCRGPALNGEGGSQAQWILRGRKAGRIVVESEQDALAFAGGCELPVVHVWELLEHGKQ